MPSTRRGRLLLLLALAVAAGCAWAARRPGHGERAHVRQLLRPRRHLVPAGTRVRFPNEGRAPHNAAVDGSWRTPERVGADQAATVVLELPGVYASTAASTPPRTAARAWPPPWSSAMSATTRARRRPVTVGGRSPGQRGHPKGAGRPRHHPGRGRRRPAGRPGPGRPRDLPSRPRPRCRRWSSGPRPQPGGGGRRVPAAQRDQRHRRRGGGREPDRPQRSHQRAVLDRGARLPGQPRDRLQQRDYGIYAFDSGRWPLRAPHAPGRPTPA